MHEHRIIPLDGRAHIQPSVRQWFGDSRGHWDGDTLVVETSNFNDRVNFRGSTDGLHLVERFTRVDADTVMLEFTVDDPTTWTSSWTVVVHGKLDSNYWQIFEYACHEGNYGMVHILSGARAEDKKAESESR